MLNISRQIYAAIDTKGTKYHLPEAEIVPLGESANEKKKLDTLTKKFPILYEHENIPLPGFTLYKTDKKNWGSVDQTWLVIDPRGFLVRISSQNLEKILHVTGITEGLIQEKCVWAREDSQTKMTLVPVSSPSYIEAVKNTELIEGKISIKEVNIGDTVIMQNGHQGIFRGVLSLYGPITDYSRNSEHAPQVYLRRQIVEVDKGKFYHQVDAKILKVISKSDREITREESAQYLNDQIKAGAFFTSVPHFNGRYYSTRGMVTHASVHAVPKLKISFEEITELEATKIFHDAALISDFGQLVVESSPTNRYVIDFPYIGNNKPTLHNFEIVPIKDDVKKEKLVLAQSRTFYSRRTSGSHSLDKFKKFYKIVKYVKTETYV